MAKMSMFLCFFLFVLVAMPISSSSRMILEEDPVVVDKCLTFVCPCPPCRNGEMMTMNTKTITISTKECICNCPQCISV
ncbi:hypothetical protein MKX03_003370 [Papaver bracteatum]|nr:hypothetical protein MKX03_003370 [Papaver bracteatum]